MAGRIRRIAPELDDLIKKTEDEMRKLYGNRKGLGVMASKVLVQRLNKPKLRKIKGKIIKWKDEDYIM